MLRFILFIALIIATTTSLAAEKSKILLGQYVRDGGSGSLTVRKGKQNRLVFEIFSIGSNCHSCEVSGVISGNVGHADNGPDSKCQISFSASHPVLSIKPTTEEECRNFCGARAGFDGTYRMPPSACTFGGRKAQKDQFIHLYRARRFDQASDALQNLIAKCRSFMSWIEIDQIRNDLALAQYHNREPQQCLATLNDTLAAKVKDEEELMYGNGDVFLPPCDFDNYIEVAKSTWFNKALCTKATSNGR